MQSCMKLIVNGFDDWMQIYMETMDSSIDSMFSILQIFQILQIPSILQVFQILQIPPVCKLPICCLPEGPAAGAKPSDKKYPKSMNIN